MKPLTLLSWLVFLGFTTWVLSWSPTVVREVRSAYFSALKPFIFGGSKFKETISKFDSEVKHSKVLEQELKGAEQTRGRLALVEERLRELEAENTSLRKALAFQENAPFEVAAAQVVPFQNERPREVLLIKRTSESEFPEQAPVLDTNGLVGRVTSDFGNSLVEVLLLSDKSCQVSVRIEETNERGILVGQATEVGSDSPLLSLKHLSQNAELLPGMKVVTTGNGGVFPPGLLVGTIESILPGSFESEALVKAVVDFDTLEVVFIPLGASEIVEVKSEG